MTQDYHAKILGIINSGLALGAFGHSKRLIPGVPAAGHISKYFIEQIDGENIKAQYRLSNSTRYGLKKVDKIKY